MIQPDPMPGEVCATETWTGRYPLRPHDLLFFLHIPKTGGTSLAQTLKAQFGRKYLSVTQEILKTPESIAWDKLSAIRAHFGFNVHMVMRRRPVYITLLRDPADRLISAYGAHRRRQNMTKDFATYLENLWQDRPKKYNLQSLFIAGLRQGDRQTQLAEADVLAIALARLDEFAFVGLLEQFDRSLQLLAATFGWAAPRSIPMKNVTTTSDKPAVSREQLATIRERSHLDYALYRQAQALFARRWANLVSGDLGERHHD